MKPVTKVEALDYIRQDIIRANRQSHPGVVSKMIVQAMQWAERFGITPEEIRKTIPAAYRDRVPTYVWYWFLTFECGIDHLEEDCMWRNLP